MPHSESPKENSINERIKVGIIDDDDATRILMRATISAWGYDVVEGSDGLEAWTILNQPNPPQILIIDWLMPKCDGPSLCSRIINEYKGLRPHILMLSNLTATTNKLTGLDAGADGFMNKPFNISELKSRLAAAKRNVLYRTDLYEKNSRLEMKLHEIKEKIDTLNKTLEGSSTLSINEIKKAISELKQNLE